MLGLQRHLSRGRKDCDWQARWLISRKASCSLPQRSSDTVGGEVPACNMAASQITTGSHMAPRREGRGGWIPGLSACWRGANTAWALHYIAQENGAHGTPLLLNGLGRVCPLTSVTISLWPRGGLNYPVPVKHFSHHAIAWPTGTLGSRLLLCAANEQELGIWREIRRTNGGFLHHGCDRLISLRRSGPGLCDLSALLPPLLSPPFLKTAAEEGIRLQ